VRTGLASFAAGGIEPRFLILDDAAIHQGGIDRRRAPDVLEANAQFGGDLTPVVRLAKHGFKIRAFLVVADTLRLLGRRGRCGTARLWCARGRAILRPRHSPAGADVERGNTGARSSPRTGDQIGRFLDDYHRRLEARESTAVKVDSQATIEGVATGRAGASR